MLLTAAESERFTCVSGLIKVTRCDWGLSDFISQTLLWHWRLRHIICGSVLGLQQQQHCNLCQTNIIFIFEKEKCIFDIWNNQSLTSDQSVEYLDQSCNLYSHVELPMSVADPYNVNICRSLAQFHICFYYFAHKTLYPAIAIIDFSCKFSRKTKLRVTCTHNTRHKTLLWGDLSLENDLIWMFHIFFLLSHAILRAASFGLFRRIFDATELKLSRPWALEDTQQHNWLWWWLFFFVEVSSIV